MDSAAPSTAQDKDDAPEKDHEDGDEGEQTALLPKSLFGGKVEPGKICKVKIEHCYEDECEVSWVKDDSGSKLKSNMEESEGALDKMAVTKE